MKKFAIVCAEGIGDALLMQIATAHLQKLGHAPVAFSNHLLGLQSWFPGFAFEKPPSIDQIDATFDRFDAIVLQHDNTPKAKKIRSLPKPVYSLYGSHLLAKHGPLRPKFDVKFNPSLCMATNILNALNNFFPEIPASLDNGLKAPKELIFRKYPSRIAIHPTSTSPAKNWSKKSFLKLRLRLIEEGYRPSFIASPREASDWDAPVFPTLADLAAFLYESGSLIGNDSGPGHLASNLGLPTVIIGPSIEHLSLWRPGWQPGEVVPPPKWVSYMKLTRSKWMSFISVEKVVKLFKKINVIK